MSSNGEFSTMSSGEVPCSLPQSLPSSREATACEVTSASGSSSHQAGGFVPLREFLDRFSLPRVVRLEGITGRPVLLYKQQQRSLRVTATLLLHRYRHDVRVGPEIVIPEGYPGWFSVISGNNSTASARIYRRVETLVRAGVPAFLLASPLRAYTLTHSKMENGNLQAHYTKTTIRAGEVLRLIAVFQDTRKYSSMTFSITGNAAERNQYAQCLDPHGREVFAPLTARGEFYAICQNSSGNNDLNNDAVLYRVQHLAKRQLPLRVRLIAGALPIPLPREYSGLMQLETSTRGSIVLGCIVPERPVHNPEMLELVVSGTGAPRVRRASLGYPSEARLLASPKIQRLLSACSRAIGDRATEPRVSPLKVPPIADQNLVQKEMHLRKIKPSSEAKQSDTTSSRQSESRPILKSLREGFENLKRSTSRDRSSTKQQNQQQQQPVQQQPNSQQSHQGNPGILERIARLTQSNRTRNPAKKSASFTFAVRPEIAMRSHQERYCSLEQESHHGQSASQAAKQQQQAVQRSVSAGVLQPPNNVVELEPNYSRVRDSLTPAPAAAEIQQPRPCEKVHVDDIYTEIGDSSGVVRAISSGSSHQHQKCPGSHVMARVRIIVKGGDSTSSCRIKEESRGSSNERYVNSIMVKHEIDSIITTEDEVIYNTIF